ncbi:MAG: type IX secretion system membrane protein PorP/SprF [Flavobacteriales bacterium]|nr:type IX secretion system membrane protein PorP/SprF [Flavobacteriales bacterium]
MKFVIIPLFFISLQVIGQFKTLSTFNNLTNIAVINPAFSGGKTEYSIFLNLQEYSNSQMASINYNKGLSGFSLFHFNTNYTLFEHENTHTSSIQYGGRIQLAKNHQLRLGIGLTQNSFPVYSNSNYNYITSTQLSTKYGIAYENQYFYIGASQANIPISKRSIDYYQNNLLSIQAGTKLTIPELGGIIIKPSFLYLNYEGAYHFAQVNLALNRKQLGLNLGYRNNDTFLMGGGWNFVNGFSINYAYKMTISKLSIAMYNNTHNLQLLYQRKAKASSTVNFPFFN